MGLLYALPGQELWNPLGTWAARLPSALACGAVMLALADTLLRWPQRPGRPALVALTAAFAFALSPLVLLWGRIAVSDALFSGLLALSLLLGWQTYAARGQGWWRCWLLLGLAVLAKGPVAVVLLGLTLLLFGWLQADMAGLWRRLRPLPGLAITALVALPWYGAALVVAGEPFWRSFFGYHNLQRFTVVVNNHLQPWWFFVPVLVIDQLPELGLKELNCVVFSVNADASKPVMEPAVAIVNVLLALPLKFGTTPAVLEPVRLVRLIANTLLELEVMLSGLPETASKSQPGSTPCVPVQSLISQR